MFVPFVPIVPSMTSNRNTVINKTIVYNDTVLNLKEIGDNLKVTSINDVKEYDLEKCLKLIFESNKDIIFNTIQYSKENNKVYFYTNKEIDISNWEENKTFKYKPITNKTEILEEVKNILQSEKTNNPDAISLDKVFSVMKTKSDEFDTITKNYEDIIDYKLENIYGDAASWLIYSFDYEKNLMHTGFKIYNDKYKSVYFGKKNDDLYIAKTEDVLYSDGYFVILGDVLSELYDKFIEFKFLGDYNFGIKPLNSNFYINISKNNVEIMDKKIISNSFGVSKMIYNNNYNYVCNSNAVISAIKGNEEELFKRIYVNISDCPKWMHEELGILRYNELKSEEDRKRKIQVQKDIEEYEKILKNRRQQKILSLKHKLFPWTKK